MTDTARTGAAKAPATSTGLPFVNVVRAELFKALRKRRTYGAAAFLWGLVPALLVFIGWLLDTRLGTTFLDDGTSVGLLVQTVASPAGIVRNGLVLLGNSAPLPLFMVIVVLFTALLFGEEHAHNMWKTVFTASPHRLSVLFGKLAAAMLLLGGLMLGMFAAGTLWGALGMTFLPTTFAGDWGALAGLYALQWALGLAAFAFAFLVAWLIRNLPIAVVTIFFLPGFLEAAYSFYRVVVGFERVNRLNAILQTLRLRATLEDLPSVFFTTNLYAPSREPIGRVARAFGGDALGGLFGEQSPVVNLMQPNLERAVIVMSAYGVLFLGILVWSFTRRDIS